MKSKFISLRTLLVGLVVLVMGLLALSDRLLAAPPTEPVSLPFGSEAVREWLITLDGGHYEQCWKDGGKILHDAVPLDQWIKDETDQRMKLGSCTRRALIKAQPHNRFRLRDGTAMEGQFTEMVFRTDFEHQSDMTESVNAMQESDGKWRVFAYDVRTASP